MEKILVFGGTNFIGRNLVEALVAIGDWEVVLFNRGITNPDLFPELRKIRGNRKGGEVRELSSESWDYVIDLSCYFPEELDRCLPYLKGVKKYIFVSTCSVYRLDTESTLKDEEAALRTCSKEKLALDLMETYGCRKVECERIVKESGFESLILRPSVVYGPYDSTDRFYYWMHQVKTRDKLLIPGAGKDKFSLTYVKDLVQMMVKGLGNESLNGTFNLISIPEFSLAELVDHLAELSGTQPERAYLDPDYLEKKGVQQWYDLPLWSKGDYFTFDNSKVVSQAGFVPTELKESLSVTMAWYEELNWPVPKYGLDEARKNELIQGVNGDYKALR